MRRNRSRRDKVATSNKTLYKVSYEMPFFKKKKKDLMKMKQFCKFALIMNNIRKVF